jgi:hypothetical protein
MTMVAGVVLKDSVLIAVRRAVGTKLDAGCPNRRTEFVRDCRAVFSMGAGTELWDVPRAMEG